MEMPDEIITLKELLGKLKKEGKVLLAYLYGSYVTGLQHKRSDIDLALYLNVSDKKEWTLLILY